MPSRIRTKAALSVGVLLLLRFSLTGCNSAKNPTVSTPTDTPALTVQDVQTLMTQAVEQAQRLNENVYIAIVDREANILGLFRMNGAPNFALPPDAFLGAIAKARTAAYVSSNQNAFTSLTACFTTRAHFPPLTNNTAAGPLFGVPFSNRGGSDIQPNGGAVPGAVVNGQPGLTALPGGVPIYKNGLLAGGIGVSGCSTTLSGLDGILNYCSSIYPDEIIALGAVYGYMPPNDKRSDNIYLEGIRLLYANAPTPMANFTLTWANLATLGTVDPNFPIRATPAPKFPVQGDVVLDAAHDYRVKAGQLLSADEVNRILNQAVTQAAKTRAAIRRPLGVPAQVFVAVSDLDGTILGIRRTPDATLFSFDVCAQKARSVVAFSDTSTSMSKQIRNVLGVPLNQPLAMTTRAVGFLGQRFYPPGIDLGQPFRQPVESGPLYIMIDGQFDFQFQRGLYPFQPPYQNGITIFPGGVPLYKNGRLVGGIGISGDGVEQDDYIAAAGATGFEAPMAIRSDQITYKNAKLPYVKFPRQPDL
ncbi:MAG: GlcG/HbpS family heme-binding protein [bacterium]